MSTDPATSALEGFPEVTRAAYQRFCTTRAEADAQETVRTALSFLLSRPEPHTDLLSLPPETRLREDLEADSLALAELVFLVENLFGVAISEVDLRGVETLGDLEALVKRKVGEAEADAPQA